MKLKVNNEYLKIGELSKITGIPISTLRFYEEIELLLPSYKTQANYRIYKESDARLAIFIKKARYLGFSLEEIKEIIKERKSGKSACAKVKLFAQKKIIELQEKMKGLKSLEDALKGYITECKATNDAQDSSICKLVEKVDLRK